MRPDSRLPHGLGIILHVVDHPCGQILIFGHHIVGPVHTGLSLQDITVVDEQQVVAALLTLAVDIRVGTGQRTPEWPPFHEVPWEEMSVNITGLNDLQCDAVLIFMILFVICMQSYKKITENANLSGIISSFNKKKIIFADNKITKR